MIITRALMLRCFLLQDAQYSLCDDDLLRELHIRWMLLSPST